MASSDIELTFNNSMFLKGLDEISKKLGDLTGHTEKSAKKMSSGVSMSAMSFLKINAALSMAKMGISKLMGNIPELGRTFQIAGDIISRNFLWPLRQQLMPYLQKFLNWVRDHRAMFVRWGGALTSVFNVVVTGIKVAVNLLKPFYEAAMKFFKGIFGGTADSVDKMATMVMFKISAVMIYLEAVLGPMMRSIAALIWGIIDGIKEFVEGFAEMASTLGGGEIFDLIKDIIDALGELVGAGEESTGTMKTLGEVFALVVIPPLKLLLILIKAIVTYWNLLKAVGQFAIGDSVGAINTINKQRKRWGVGAKEGEERAGQESYNPSLMPGSPEETAWKKKQESKVITNNNVTNIHVTADTEENAHKVGKIIDKHVRQSVLTAAANRG